jgi:hypothetical protein
MRTPKALTKQTLVILATAASIGSSACGTSEARPAEKQCQAAHPPTLRSRWAELDRVTTGEPIEAAAPEESCVEGSALAITHR